MSSPATRGGSVSGFSNGIGAGRVEGTGFNINIGIEGTGFSSGGHDLFVEHFEE